MDTTGRPSTVTQTHDTVTQEGFRRVCAVCGVVFWAKHPGARYCSAACRQRAYRERKRKQEPAQVEG